MGKLNTIFLSLATLYISLALSTNLVPRSMIIFTPVIALDSETVNWVQRVDSAGGTVSDSIISAVDDYVKEVKGLKFQTTSIRNLLLRENWFCGNFTAASVPLFRSSSVTRVFGAIKDSLYNFPFSEYSDTGQASGFKGNGINRYISTGFNPAEISELGLNSAHYMIFSMSDTMDQGRMGCEKSGHGFIFSPKLTNGKTNFRINSQTDTSVILPASSNYILVQRSSSQALNVYYRDSLISTIQNNNSTSKPNMDLAIGALKAPSGPNSYSSFRFGGYSVGRSFTTQQQLIHYNAVQRLMNRLGRQQALPPPPPPVSNLDIETINWVQRVDSAGGTVSDSILTAVDDYVKEVKGLKFQNTSIRNLLLRENWFCGNFNAAFVPLFRSDSSVSIRGSFKDLNNNFTSAGYSDTGQSSGLKGNGVNRYISTGFNPSLVNEIGLNDAHFMIYSMSDTLGSGRMGCEKSGHSFAMSPRLTNGRTSFRVNSMNDTSVALPSTNNYILVQRSSSQALNVYYRDSLMSTIQNNNSTAKPSMDLTIGALKDANGNVSMYSTYRFGGYSVGKSFTTQQQLIHYNAVQKLMNRLGRQTLPPNFSGVDVKSKLFTFTGSNLTINYETEFNGMLQFEIQDSAGIPYPNFSMENCLPISGSSFSHVVNWTSGSNISSLANIPVILKIRMFRADLFTLQFKNEIVQTDSSKNGFKIGVYKQFFADTLLFGNILPLQRKMHNPVKNPLPIIVPNGTWESNFILLTYSNIARSSSVFKDKLVYKMWLRAQNYLGTFPIYYESIDGLNWTRPSLESFKFNGSMDNNVMSDAPYHHHSTVIDDSLYNQNDSTRRYKSVYNNHTFQSDSRLYVSFSYDGVLWIPYSGNPLRIIGEDLHTSGWNPVLGKYLGYFRDSLGIRKVGRYLSDDWIDWTYTGTILKPDSLDVRTTHFYNMAVLFKDSVYWGFAGHFQLNANADEDPVNPTRTDNTIFTELLFSRDGINFVRCGNRQPFLNYGQLGAWDDQMVLPIGVPVQFGNEYYIYYNGFNFKHVSNPAPPAGGGLLKAQVGLARIGVDRFVSLSHH